MTAREKHDRAYFCRVRSFTEAHSSI